MMDEKYNQTGQASIWQWVKTVDQFGEACFNKATPTHFLALLWHYLTRLWHDLGTT